MKRLRSNSNMDVVTINVGGKLYQTTRTTLVNVPGMLSSMFEGPMKAGGTVDGNVFIDRDGELFGYVLSFLRNGTLIVPDNDHIKRMLRLEFDYFSIDVRKRVDAIICVTTDGYLTAVDADTFEPLLWKIKLPETLDPAHAFQGKCGNGFLRIDFGNHLCNNSIVISKSAVYHLSSRSWTVGEKVVIYPFADSPRPRVQEGVSMSRQNVGNTKYALISGTSQHEVHFQLSKKEGYGEWKDLATVDDDNIWEYECSTYRIAANEKYVVCYDKTGANCVNFRFCDVVADKWDDESNFHQAHQDEFKNDQCAGVVVKDKFVFGYSSHPAIYSYRRGDVIAADKMTDDTISGVHKADTPFSVTFMFEGEVTVDPLM